MITRRSSSRTRLYLLGSWLAFLTPVLAEAPDMMAGWACGTTPGSGGFVANDCEDDSNGGGLRHCRGNNKIVQWALPNTIDFAEDFTFGVKFALRGWAELFFSHMGTELGTSRKVQTTSGNLEKRMWTNNRGINDAFKYNPLLSIVLDNQGYDDNIGGTKQKLVYRTYSTSCDTSSCVKPSCRWGPSPYGAGGVCIREDALETQQLPGRSRSKNSTGETWIFSRRSNASSNATGGSLPLLVTRDRADHHTPKKSRHQGLTDFTK